MALTKSLLCLSIQFQAIRNAASSKDRKDEAKPAETESCETAAITAGAYSHVYGTLSEIGRGAFGCVMTGYRKEDGRMVRGSRKDRIVHLISCYL